MQQDAEDSIDGGNTVETLKNVVEEYKNHLIEKEPAAFADSGFSQLSLRNADLKVDSSRVRSKYHNQMIRRSGDHLHGLLSMSQV